MIKINRSVKLREKLMLLNKYSNRVTITYNTLTTKSIQIVLSTFCDGTFTVKIRDFLQLIEQTDIFEIEDSEIKYSFILNVKDKYLNIKKKCKVYDEIYTIPCGDPLLSVCTNPFSLLSEDDQIINANSNGEFSISSSSTIKTKITFSELEVLKSETNEINVKVRYKDMKMIEEFNENLIFCFFKNHILIYVLESEEVTNIFFVPILI